MIAVFEGAVDDEFVEGLVLSVVDVVRELEALQKKTGNFLFLSNDIAGDLQSGGDVDIYLQSGQELFFAMLRLNGWEKIISVYDTKSRFFYKKKIGGLVVNLDVMLRLVIRIGKINYYYTEDVLSVCVGGVSFVSPETFQQYYAAKVFLSDDELGVRKSKLKRALDSDREYLLESEAQKKVVENHFEKSKAKYSLIERVRLACGRSDSLRTYIMFVGVDGAGKGTYINMLRESFDNNAVFSKYLYLGHNNYEMSLIKKIKACNQRREGKSKVLRLLYYFLFSLELLVRQYKLQSFQGYIFVDRLPVFEPVSNGGVIYSFLDWLYRRLVPRPSIVFFLCGEVEEIWERKKEHEVTVLRSMQNRIKTLAVKADIPLVEIVTTGRSIEATGQDLKEYFCFLGAWK